MTRRRMRAPAWLSVAFLALAVACGGGSTGDDPTDDDAGHGGATLTLRMLDAGDMSGVVAARTWTARSQAEFDALWSAHRPASSVPSPPVDFTAEIVVAVFLGQRVSSGFGVDLATAVAVGDGGTVFWDETYPGANCPAGLPVVTHPYAIAALPRVEGAVTYVGGSRAVPCP